jgi:hypothetical protein
VEGKAFAIEAVEGGRFKVEGKAFAIEKGDGETATL